MYNKKGSPVRLGKPTPGQWRRPTSGEAEYCGLRRYDRICVHPDTGRITIERCVRPYAKETRMLLQGEEADNIVMDLYDYWSR